MKKSQQAYLYASLAVVLWGTIPTAFKIALSELNIVTMLGITTLISTAVLFAIMILTGKLRLLRQTTGRELLWSALLGLVNPVAYYLILLTAYSRLPGQVAQPINMIWPIILVFFSIPLLGQRIPARSFLALAISLAGVYIIYHRAPRSARAGQTPWASSWHSSAASSGLFISSLTCATGAMSR